MHSYNQYYVDESFKTFTQLCFHDSLKSPPFVLQAEGSIHTLYSKIILVVVIQLRLAMKEATFTAVLSRNPISRLSLSTQLTLDDILHL